MTGNPAVADHMRAIGAIARDTYGLTVVEVSGWTTRGHSSTFAPAYVIEHHTAATVDITSMLCDGRPDLAGPLCNFELRRDGTVGLLAAGVAWHAGAATVSNSQSYGIEATGPIPTGNTGADAFPNYAAYVALVAAVCKHHSWGMDRVLAHKEIAPDRKIDPVFDMNVFRAAVSAALSAAPTAALEWWQMTIPDSELAKIASAAVDAFESPRGQAALRKAAKAEDDALYKLLSRGEVADGTISPAHARISHVGIKDSITANLTTFIAMNEAGLDVDLTAIRGDIEAIIREATAEALAGVEVSGGASAEDIADAVARVSGERLSRPPEASP